jgi:phage baseplate assembly protein W
MPIPQTIRVNPLDLQGNIAIGCSLPFNGPAGPFNSTYSTKDQVKSNLINLLLTSPGERIMNPQFGCNLRNTIFEGINEDLTESIQNIISTSVSIFVPEVELTEILVDISNPDSYTVSVIIKYRLIISQEADQVTLQFT